LWKSEEAVNDLNDATSEIHVLTSISRAWADREHEAYSLSDGSFLEQARVEIHLLVGHDSLDDLARGQVCICGFHQSSADEGWLACEVGREVGALKDMIGEKGGDQ